MSQQIILNTHNQKTDQVNVVIGNENNNPLPITVREINAMDLVGLSWVFIDETFSKKITAGGI